MASNFIPMRYPGRKLPVESHPNGFLPHKNANFARSHSKSELPALSPLTGHLPECISETPSPVLKKPALKPKASKIRRRSMQNPALSNILLEKSSSVELRLPLLKPRMCLTPFSKAARSNTIDISSLSDMRRIVKSVHCNAQPGIKDGVAKSKSRVNYFTMTQIHIDSPYVLLGICSGQGDHGYQVSKFVKRNFPVYVKKELTRNIHESAYILESAYKSMQMDLQGTSVKCVHSGSSCAAVLIRESMLFCANVGNARAFLGRRSGELWHAIPLSNEHTLSDPEERRRIEKKLKASQLECNGPYKILISPEIDLQLPVTRSIGHLASIDSGVISSPEIITKRITSEDKLVVIASAGVWEYMSSYDVLDVVGKAWEKGDAELACEKLVDKAVKRWGLNLEDVVVAVAFLQ